MHIFIIFSLNNITNSLEFMRDEKINLMPKILLLISSFIMFYVFLFAMGSYAKLKCQLNIKFFLPIVCIGCLFVALMFIFRENMYVNIAVSVAFVFSVTAIIFRFGKKNDTSEEISKQHLL